MKVLEKRILVEKDGIRIILIRLFAPDIAAKAKPGQFVVVMATEKSERVPLTVVDHDQDSVTLIFQELGYSTALLGMMDMGAALYALTGPLGHPTEIKRYGTVILVGGGVGIAEIYPVAKALKAKGNKVISILGSRTKDLLILEEEMAEVSEVHVCTDDGSKGREGFTTDILRELLTRDEGRGTRGDLVYTVGPIPMMKKVAEATKERGVKTMASLNALMVDGTGMCGCCRVTIGKEVKFTCIDGPEFDAHQVDWGELQKRNCVYEDKERHICNLSED